MSETAAFHHTRLAGKTKDIAETRRSRVEILQLKTVHTCKEAVLWLVLFRNHAFAAGRPSGHGVILSDSKPASYEGS